jgi:membrane protease YdiL (CAAX protease family)
LLQPDFFQCIPEALNYAKAFSQLHPATLTSSAFCPLLNEPTPSNSSSNNSQFLSTCGFELAIGGCGLLLGFTIGPDARAMVPQIQQWSDIGYGVLWGTLAGIPMMLFVFLFSLLPMKAIRQLHALNQQRIVPFFLGFTPAQLLVFGLCAGVCEELFFRGWLQSSITGPIDASAPWQPGVVLGVLLGAILFGFCHLLSPLYFTLATFAGIYLGVLLVETQNLLVPITAHAVYDLAMLFWLLLPSSRKASEGDLP